MKKNRFIVLILLSFLISGCNSNNRDKNTIYYIYCDYGNRSKHVVSYLNSLGYNCVNIEGGYNNYLLEK